MRRPRTTAEKRANQGRWGRAKRRGYNLSSSFSDIKQANLEDRSWKQYRKKAVQEDDMKPRSATDDQRARMRGCLYSACETAKDLTPVYLCRKPKQGAACKLHSEVFCKDYETFPGRFNN